MNLFSTSLWIFLALIFLLILTAAFPNPWVIGANISIGSLLVLGQAIIILKDKEEEN